jgi:hypothetical protein
MAAGFALATKHSGILVFPILIALATCEVIRGELNPRKAHNILEPLPTPARRFFKLGTAIMGIGLIAGAILWAFYGFHLEPRSGVDGQPRLMQYAAQLQHPIQAKLIVQFAKWHLLPESYLYGLADVGVTAEFSHSYLLGKIYPHGKWFYFPVAFAIKSTALEGDRIPTRVNILTRPRSDLLPGRNDLWDEHRRAPYPAGVSVPYRDCGLDGINPDTQTAAVGLRYRVSIPVRRSFVAARFSGLCGVLQRDVGRTLANLQIPF